MNKFVVYETDQFLADLEEISFWILATNIDQSESFAESKIEDFMSELRMLRSRLEAFPLFGEASEISDVRRFPLYEGRYSIRWVVDQLKKAVTLVAISDSKHPKALREFIFDDNAE